MGEGLRWGRVGKGGEVLIRSPYSCAWCAGQAGAYRLGFGCQLTSQKKKDTVLQWMTD